MKHPHKDDEALRKEAAAYANSFLEITASTWNWIYDAYLAAARKYDGRPDPLLSPDDLYEQSINDLGEEKEEARLATIDFWTRYVNQFIEAYDEYVNLLGAEINDMVGLHLAHGGWQSSRSEKGIELRQKIKALKEMHFPSPPLEPKTETDWIDVKDRLPEVDEYNQSNYCLVYIDNPFFKDGNYHVAYCQKNDFGICWQGIESNVHRGNNPVNVTHWRLLPSPPSGQDTLKNEIL